MGGPSAAIAVVAIAVFAIGAEVEACASIYHQRKPTSIMCSNERLTFPTRAPTIIAGVTFAKPETTTRAPWDCSITPCDRGSFCSRHSACHRMECACGIGEFPPYHLCHDPQNPWCKFQLEPADKTACGRLSPKSLDRLGWSVIEDSTEYQKRIKKLREEQESQMKQLCNVLPPQPEGWRKWCGE